MSALRVLIVDDQPMVRQGLSLLLELLPGVVVAGQAANGQEALDVARHFAADVVLMDVRMPVMDGAQATRAFHARGGPPVILMTTFDEPEDMVAGLQAGASGYLFKNVDIHELHDAMRRVRAGERVIHPRVAQAVADAEAVDAAPGVTLQAPLTAREQAILGALSAGASNKQIAQRLGISDGTVKTHLSNLFFKLGAANRTEAVYRARQLRLLP
ncbi:response regulator [Deinococcus maricopensis]|uniref:response regulator n=1 Tax=Deinococcus maricopensis TaxID=309887 RepID=UPI0009780E3E|nr:response regulator transcription factor [Deinococcus maricopensis]